MTLATMTDTQKYRFFVQEAESRYLRVVKLQAHTRARLARVYQGDTYRDVDTLDKLVADDPRVKAAIQDETFARGRAVMYGSGAIIEALDSIIGDRR